MATVYPSKVDFWLLILLMSAVVASVGAGLLVVSLRGSAQSVWLAVLVASPGAILPVWLLASTYYRFEPTHLFISCGPVRTRIPFSEIHQVTPTRNPLSSPALSLDRLKIEYGRGQSVMISPRDREDFIRDLNAARDRC